MSDLAIHKPLRPLTPQRTRSDDRDSQVMQSLEAAARGQARAREQAQAQADLRQADAKLPRNLGERILAPLKACLWPPRRQ